MNGRIAASGSLALVFVAVVATPAAAQHDHGAHDHTSPYADFLDRDIKALSAEEVESLRAGMGMGFALAAELNGHPGPRHVLDMAPLLELSDEQRAATRAVFDEMEADARTLGEEIVGLERELDRAFAQATLTESRLEELVGAIAAARGRLRIVHLRAHLQMVPILTDEQRAAYELARGYGG